jgi:PST family polysaccharide transporter
LVHVVYGTAWLGSAGALGVLAVFGTIRVVFDLMATFLIARGGSRPVLLVQLVWVAALIPAMIGCVHAWGIVGAGVAHLIVAVVVVLPVYLLVLGRQGVSLPALARAAAAPVGAAVLTGTVVWVSSRAVDHAWRAVVLGAAIGVVVYAATLHRWLRPRLSASRPTPAMEAA